MHGINIRTAQIAGGMYDTPDTGDYMTSASPTPTLDAKQEVTHMICHHYNEGVFPFRT